MKTVNVTTKTYMVKLLVAGADINTGNVVLDYEDDLHALAIEVYEKANHQLDRRGDSLDVPLYLFEVHDVESGTVTFEASTDKYYDETGNWTSTQRVQLYAEVEAEVIISVSTI